jgi:hypothetical protein
MSEAFKRITPRTDKEVREVVRLMLAEKFFGHWMANDATAVGMIFMPIGLGALTEFDADEMDRIAIWEDLDQAGPRSFNGYPIFMSCRIWLKDDMKKALDLYQKALDAQEQALRGGE